MSEKLLQKIDKYMANPEFEPEKVGKVSQAASGLCKWVRAMHLYGNVSKTVAPKREKLKNAMMSLEKKQKALQKAQVHTHTRTHEHTTHVRTQTHTHANTYTHA